MRWYEYLETDTTTVFVNEKTVEVRVRRGHASEWHDELRSIGFRWDRYKQRWVAFLDDCLRNEVARQNRELDAKLAGMSAENRYRWRRTHRWCKYDPTR